MAEQNQEKFKALHIAPETYGTSDLPVIWHHTISFLNDANWGPAVHVDSEKLWELEGNISWDDFRNIEKLTVIDDIPDYKFIKQFAQLKSLAIINSKILSDLAFIESLEKLEYLQIIQCYQVSDIAPIINLRNKQLEKRNISKSNSTVSCSKFIYEHPILQRIALIDCNVRSLEPFRQDESSEMDELHLRFNNIRDVEPLGVMNCAYLDLSHNHIENIAPLFDSEDRCYYGINLRHNLIKDISGIKEENTGVYRQTKIWIDHNPKIPLEQLIKWKENNQLWIMDMKLEPARPKSSRIKKNKKSSKPD